MRFDLGVGMQIHCGALQGQRVLMAEPPSCEVFTMTYETSIQIGKGGHVWRDTAVEPISIPELENGRAYSYCCRLTSPGTRTIVVL